MHVKGFLHKLLLPVMHKKRLDTLVLFVTTLIRSKKLSLTELGRAIDLSIQERSGIRRADRFLGNKKIYEERDGIQEVIAKLTIGSRKRPDIIVDWSNVPNSTDNVLRAALVAKSRAITLYEEVHPEKKLGNQKVQNKFLDKLMTMLPKACEPIIITDGGFHNVWFRKVVKLGWDYIGRIRAGSGKKYSQGNSKEWKTCADLCKKATCEPRWKANIKLCKRDSLETQLCLYKGKRKGRTSLTRSGKKRQDTDALDYRKAAKEPWLLATSLIEGHFTAEKVIKRYSMRMKIEEGFRDLKSSKYGFGFEKSYSKDIKRIEILLLIAMVASFIAWLIGLVAEINNLHLQFQSNSIKKRRVLSLFYLGCQVVRKKIKIDLAFSTIFPEGICNVY